MGWSQRLTEWVDLTSIDAAINQISGAFPDLHSMGMRGDRLGIVFSWDAFDGFMDPSMVKVSPSGQRRPPKTEDDEMALDMLVEQLKEEVFPMNVGSASIERFRQHLGKHVFKPGQVSNLAAEKAVAVESPFKVFTPHGVSKQEPGSDSSEINEALFTFMFIAIERALEQAPAGYKVWAVERPLKNEGKNLHWIVQHERDAGDPVKAEWLEQGARAFSIEGPASVTKVLKPYLEQLTRFIQGTEDDVRFLVQRTWSVADQDDLKTPPEVPEVPGQPVVAKIVPKGQPEGLPTGSAATGCLLEALMDGDEASRKEFLMNQRLPAGSETAKVRL